MRAPGAPGLSRCRRCHTGSLCRLANLCRCRRCYTWPTRCPTRRGPAECPSSPVARARLHPTLPGESWVILGFARQSLMPTDTTAWWGCGERPFSAACHSPDAVSRRTSDASRRADYPLGGIQPCRPTSHATHRHGSEHRLPGPDDWSTAVDRALSGRTTGVAARGPRSAFQWGPCCPTLTGESNDTRAPFCLLPWAGHTPVPPAGLPPAGCGWGRRGGRASSRA